MTGPEVSSLVASTTKVYWQKGLKEEGLKQVHSKSKIPGNCTFLSVKEVNKKIFAKGAPFTRTRDIKMQEIQRELGYSTGNVVRAMAQLSDHMEEVEKSQSDSTSLQTIREVLELLQNATKLSGKTNQLIMTQRREAFKQHIPKDLQKICDDPDENASKLYGDDLEDKLQKIQAENKIFKVLDEKDQKKPTSAKSGNSKTYQKPRGGSNNQKDGYSRKKEGDQGKDKDKDQREEKDRYRTSSNQNKNRNRRGGKKRR